jgi:hypothetical protein
MRTEGGVCPYRQQSKVHDPSHAGHGRREEGLGSTEMENVRRDQGSMIGDEEGDHVRDLFG